MLICLRFNNILFITGDDHRDRLPRYANEENDCRRASSRGIIPRAKIKTVKMTFVIVFGKCKRYLLLRRNEAAPAYNLLYSANSIEIYL